MFEYINKVVESVKDRLKLKDYLSKQSSELQDVLKGPSLSRRNFLKGLSITIGATAISSQVLANDDLSGSKDLSNNNEQQNFKDIAYKIGETLDSIFEEIFLANGSYLNTVGDAGVLFIFNIIIGNFLSSSGIKIGNAYIEKNYQHKKFSGFSFAEGVIIGPITEEIIFRLIPYGIFSLVDGKLRWGVNITSSLIFAGIHNFYESSNGKYEFSLEHIPVSQFIGGLYYYYVTDKYGISHAFLSHILYNFFCYLAISKLEG